MARPTTPTETGTYDESGAADVEMNVGNQTGGQDPWEEGTAGSPDEQDVLLRDVFYTSETNTEPAHTGGEATPRFPTPQQRRHPS